MNAPELERLRAADPVPTDPGAPPIERVLALIEADSDAGGHVGDGGRARGRNRRQAARRARRRRAIWPRARALAGPIGALAVVAVIAAVVLVIHVGGSSQTNHTAISPTFTGGMLGDVDVYEVHFNGDFGFISFERIAPGGAGHSHKQSYWQATTTDGGGSWRTKREPQLLFSVVGTGDNLWAAADEGGNSAEGIVVSHDGGRNWTPVPVPVSKNPYQLDAAGGGVWAINYDCGAPGCNQVRSGPAAGSRLRPVRMPIPIGPPGQHAGPSIFSEGAIGIVALSAASAYVSPVLGGHSGEPWLLTDGGQRWQRVPPGPCPGIGTSGDGHGTIWRSCLPDGKQAAAIAISTDGGRHWVSRPAPFATGILYPESAQVAWAQPDDTSLRTTDGGRSWQTVWPNDHLPAGARPGRTELFAQSATDATEIVHVLRHSARGTITDLVAYRTSDGGRAWQPAPVPLPNR